MPAAPGPLPADLQQLLHAALSKHQAGELPAALALYQQVLARDALNFDALHLGGVAAAQAGQMDLALALLKKACAVAPSQPSAHQNLARLLVAQGQLAQALPVLQRALQLNPADAELWFQQGLAQQQLGQADPALQSYGELIARHGNHPIAHNNRGALLMQRGELAAALADFARAAELAPDYAEAHNNQGVILSLLQRHAEALPSYERALQLKPDYRQLQGRRLHSAMQACDWTDFDARCQALRDQIEAGVEAAAPFVTVTLLDEPALQLRLAELHAARLPRPAVPPEFAKTASPRRIRLGYFSADLHDHATAHLMAGLFEQHDRSRFELHAFSFGPATNDAMRQRVRAAFDHFHEVGPLSAEQTAALARELQIDIAIDLKGYTRDSRPAVFAQRAAPVQINYLGYPGSMGADFIDYLIADHTLVPKELRAHYSEKLLRLPGSYQVNDSRRAAASAAPSRAALGLPEQAFVFCSFNAAYKITPAHFARWMRILQQLPGSVLWLLEGSAVACAHLRREAARQGLDPQRLVFAPALPVAEHLARQAAADLFLDCHPCNAHTTASDALWAGLPLLTLSGQSFASRVAASLLRAMDLNELVCESGEQFEQQALALARDPQRLSALRRKLADSRDAKNGLFDTEAFARVLEQAYRQVHERRLAGLMPADLDIERPA